MNKNGKTGNNLASRLARIGLIVWLMVLFSSLKPAPVAHAATIIVNSANDDLIAGDSFCTLREAINNVNAGGQTTGGDCVAADGVNDTITFAGNYTITLNSALPVIANNVIITGNGESNTIIQASTCNPVTLPGGCTPAMWRVFYINSGLTVNFNDMTIRHGHAYDQANGGGVYNRGTLDITRCTVADNHAGIGTTDIGYGGGIYNDGGTLNITNSTISGNYAGHRGGGIANEYSGVLDVNNSTFNGNESRWGGGIVLRYQDPTANVTNSTFTSNHANIIGGGINVYDGGLTVTHSTFSANTSFHGAGLGNRTSLTVRNSTITGNTSTNNGGGIYTYGGTTAVSNSTIAGNTAGAGDGIYNNLSTITLSNSIVSGNGVVNCVGTITDSGNNLEFPGVTCGGFAVQADPLLGTLAENGSPTHTHALQIGSPAIDAGNNSTCETNDQRGATRPLDGNADGTVTCDIGAFELGDMQCGIQTAAEPATYSFFGNVSVEITDDGTDLDCMQATDIPWNHPHATSGSSGLGIETGKYWTINGFWSDGSTTATADYTLNLTLPHSVVSHADVRVCKYPGSQGGFGWDCARTGSNTTTVWLDGIQTLSDWAVGDQVGPTAVSLRRIAAHVNSNVLVVLLAGLFGIMIIGLGLIRRERRVRVVQK